MARQTKSNVAGVSGQLSDVDAETKTGNETAPTDTSFVTSLAPSATTTMMTTTTRQRNMSPSPSPSPPSTKTGIEGRHNTAVGESRGDDNDDFVDATGGGGSCRTTQPGLYMDAYARTPSSSSSSNSSSSISASASTSTSTSATNGSRGDDGTDQGAASVPKHRYILVAVDLGHVGDVLPRLRKSHLDMYPNMRVHAFADFAHHTRRGGPSLVHDRLVVSRVATPGPNLADCELMVSVVEYLRDFQPLTRRVAFKPQSSLTSAATVAAATTTTTTTTPAPATATSPMVILVSRDAFISFAFATTLRNRGVDVHVCTGWDQLCNLFP